jgi:aldose 1-epimerase
MRRWSRRAVTGVALCTALLPPRFARAAAAAPERRPFGTLGDGRAVSLYTLRTDVLTVRITDYGARIVTLETPDRAGRAGDIVLGFDALDGYLKDRPFFGAVVGRYANRIAGGRFVLDGRGYQVTQNEGRNSLHGGAAGFDRRLWQAHVTQGAVTLRYLSPDGEEGYPGTLEATVRYSVQHDALRVDYQARTDRATVVNLSNHSYFNLGGHASGPVLDHELTLHAGAYTPVDDGLIPTGEIRDVAGSAFDFLRPQRIGARIDADDELRRRRGYDINYVLERGEGALAVAARVREPGTGRIMEVLTDQPGLQFYSGNRLDGSFVGKGGTAYGMYGGFCLETQHFPDSPNHPAFPSTVLRPGERFHSTTVFRFLVERAG